MANLYLDEDLANFAEPLSDAAHRAVLARDVGQGRTDAWHLATASKQQRVLVTFNERDYKYLHRLWTLLRIFGLFSRKHAGILTTTGQLEPNAWVPAIENLLRTNQPTQERMWIWKPARGEWQEDDWRPEP
jgi:hypothetical protein